MPNPECPVALPTYLHSMQTTDAHSGSLKVFYNANAPQCRASTCLSRWRSFRRPGMFPCPSDRKQVPLRNPCHVAHLAKALHLHPQRMHGAATVHQSFTCVCCTATYPKVWGAHAQGRSRMITPLQLGYIGKSAKRCEPAMLS